VLIRDNSGLSKVGLALLRKNRDKLTPPKSVELKIRGEQQVVIVYGPYDMFESNSFGWGRDDDRTKALAEAVATLGWPLPFETIREFDSTEDRIIKQW